MFNKVAHTAHSEALPLRFIFLLHYPRSSLPPEASRSRFLLARLQAHSWSNNLWPQLLFLVRLQRPAIVAIVAIVAEQEDDLRMDAVDCEAGWDSIELIAAGLSGIVSCYKS